MYKVCIILHLKYSLSTSAKCHCNLALKKQYFHVHCRTLLYFHEHVSDVQHSSWRTTMRFRRSSKFSDAHCKGVLNMLLSRQVHLRVPQRKLTLLCQWRPALVLLEPGLDTSSHLPRLQAVRQLLPCTLAQRKRNPQSPRTLPARMARRN